MPSARRSSRTQAPGSVAEDEVFIALIRVAREDPAIGDRLRGILGLDDFQRSSLLNTWIEEAKLRGAPREFTRALAHLRDAAIARRALEALSSDS